MNESTLNELLSWRQEVQLKKQGFLSALSLMESGDFEFSSTQALKLRFRIKASGHELFMAEQLIDEEIKSIDISELITIINYDL